jgi:hypothetical protein
LNLQVQAPQTNKESNFGLIGALHFCGEAIITITGVKLIEVGNSISDLLSMCNLVQSFLHAGRKPRIHIL